MTLFMCSSLKCDVTPPPVDEPDDDALVSEFVDEDVDVAGLLLLLLLAPPPPLGEGGMICTCCDVNVGAGVSPLPPPSCGQAPAAAPADVALSCPLLAVLKCCELCGAGAAPTLSLPLSLCDDDDDDEFVVT